MYTNIDYTYSFDNVDRYNNGYNYVVNSTVKYETNEI